MAVPEKPAFGPGMTMPVVAGVEYTLKDNTGESLILEGRDDPLTLAFCEAFDNYLAARSVLSADSEPCKMAWQACLDKFDELPKRIKDNLPSHRSGGIAIPGSKL